jgi:hypothetical protein
MSYEYKKHRDLLFTDEGQRMLLGIRDETHRLLREAGAVRLGKAIGKATGDTWMMLACMDRLEELGEIMEIPTHGGAQDRIFVKAP